MNFLFEHFCPCLSEVFECCASFFWLCTCVLLLTFLKINCNFKHAYLLSIYASLLRILKIPSSRSVPILDLQSQRSPRYKVIKSSALGISQILNEMLVTGHRMDLILHVRTTYT